MKSFLSILIFIYSLTTFGNGSWFAHNGEVFTEHYASVLHNKSFVRGDIIQVGSRKFEYVDYLGEGNSTKVFKVNYQGEEYALRLPFKGL